MRLIVARCEVNYTGRLTARLPEALRLLMIKADGVGARARRRRRLQAAELDDPSDGDRGGARPDGRAQAQGRRPAGDPDRRGDLRLDARDGPPGRRRLEKDGVEAHLQEALAAAPGWCGEGFRLVRREWPTDIGPVDLMCRDDDDGWIAVEIKRIGTIDAVEQLTRYLERIRLDPALGECRGVLAAQVVKPQARVLAEARGIAWVEVDLAVLRGEREPALTLFGA